MTDCRDCARLAVARCSEYLGDIIPTVEQQSQSGSDASDSSPCVLEISRLLYFRPDSANGQRNPVQHFGGTRFGRSRAVAPSDRLGTHSPLLFAARDVNQGHRSAISDHGLLKLDGHVNTVELYSRLCLELGHAAEETKEAGAGR